jgi:hypothetical protein
MGMNAESTKRVAEAAARRQACLGGAEIHSVSYVGEPTSVDEGLWVVAVRVMMVDGSVRAFCCDATEREVFAVREVASQTDRETVCS